MSDAHLLKTAKPSHQCQQSGQQAKTLSPFGDSTHFPHFILLGKYLCSAKTMLYVFSENKTGKIKEPVFLYHGHNNKREDAEGKIRNSICKRKIV